MHGERPFLRAVPGRARYTAHMPRVLGIDHGDKRIGVAISDAGGSLASPRRVVRGEAALFEYLEQLIPEEEVERIIVGLPLDMSGSVGPKALQVKDFAERVGQRTGLPVETWDERMSSIQAEDLLRTMGVHGERRKERVDMIAAQIILQSWLDQPRSQGAESED